MDMKMTDTIKPWLSTLAFALATLTASASASADALTENFDDGVPSGWTVNNLSDPLGFTNWFQGSTRWFEAHDGAADSYVGANFNAGADTASISDWLIMPTSTYRNGDTLSFFTRTADFSFNPDRLDVRFSSVGGTDVGESAQSVGTFTTLMLSINPNQQQFGYPDTWTQFNVTLSGLAGPTSGAFAFHYVVNDAGPDGFNSNYIGIDTVQVTSVAAAVPEPATYLMLGAGLGLIGSMRKRQARA
jgi:hypothetical protein